VFDFSHQLIHSWPREVVRYPQPATRSVAPAKRLWDDLTSSSAEYIKAIQAINAIRYKPRDKCPYAEVVGRLIMGLLDTGAAISVIGGNLAEHVIKSRIPFERGGSPASTADGKKQVVLGRI